MKKFRLLLLTLASLLASAAVQAQNCTLVIDNPGNISEVIYDGAAREVQASTSLPVGWSGSKQLHVAPAEGCTIESVIFFDATWGTESELPVGDDGCFDYTLNYVQAYGKISIYTSGGGAEPTHQVMFDINDDAYDAIKSVKANAKEVEEWNLGFEAKEGAVVTVEVNTEEYKIDSFLVNGESPDTPFAFTVTDDTEVTVRAHKFGNLRGTLIVDDPAAIKVYEGTSVYNRKEIILTGGITSFEVSEKEPYIMIERVPEFRIVSLTDAEGGALDAGKITVTQNATITVVTEPIVRDLHATLFISGLSNTSEAYLKGADGHMFDITEGYQTIEFAPEDMPAELYLRGGFEDRNTVIVDGETHKGSFFGWRHTMTIEDGAVVLAFVDETPEVYEMKITSDTTVPFVAMQHGVTEVEDFSSFAMHAGTELIIYPTSVEKLKVTANITDTESETTRQEEIKADDEGIHRIKVTAPTELVIEKAIQSALDTISTDACESDEIYNMQGMRIATDRANLPAGLYIIGGKKVHVR